MPKSRKNAQTRDVEGAVNQQIPDRDAHLTDAALAQIDASALKWHMRAAKAPSWMLNLAAKSRVLAGIVAIIVTALLTTVVAMGVYTVLVALAALMVPGLPSAVISTVGVSANEVKASNDAFMFMAVMPVLFLVIALGVPIGLLVFRIASWLAQFVVSLVSCAVVSKQAVSRMAHHRQEHAPAKRTIKRRHLADFAAAGMKDSSGKYVSGQENHCHK